MPSRKAAAPTPQECPRPSPSPSPSLPLGVPSSAWRRRVPSRLSAPRGGTPLPPRNRPSPRNRPRPRPRIPRSPPQPTLPGAVAGRAPHVPPPPARARSRAARRAGGRAGGGHGQRAEGPRHFPPGLNHLGEVGSLPAGPEPLGCRRLAAAAGRRPGAPPRVSRAGGTGRGGGVGENILMVG